VVSTAFVWPDLDRVRTVTRSTRLTTRQPAWDWCRALPHSWQVRRITIKPVSPHHGTSDSPAGRGCAIER